MQRHDLEGRREALLRRVLRIVGAALPLRIEADRRAPSLDPGAERGIPARGPDDRHVPVDDLGGGGPPLRGLYRAHRAADPPRPFAAAHAAEARLLDIDRIAGPN